MLKFEAKCLPRYSEELRNALAAVNQTVDRVRSFLSDRKRIHSSTSPISSCSLASPSQIDEGCALDDLSAPKVQDTPSSAAYTRAMAGFDLDGVQSTPSSCRQNFEGRLPVEAGGALFATVGLMDSVIPRQEYVRDLRKEVSDLEIEIPAKRNELQALQDEVSELQRLKNEIALADTEYIDTLQVQIDEMTKQHAVHCESLEQEIEDRVQSWKEKLEAAEADAREKLQAKCIEKAEADRKVQEAIENERVLCHESLCALETECSALKQQLEHAKQNALEEIDECKTEVEAFKVHVGSSHEEEIKTLHHALAEANAEASHCHEAIVLAKSTYESNIEQHLQQIRDLEDQLADVRQQSAQELDATQQQLKYITHQLNAEQDKIVDYKTELRDMSIQHANDALELQKQAEESTKLISKLEEDIKTVTIESETKVDVANERVLRIEEVRAHLSVCLLAASHLLCMLAGMLNKAKRCPGPCREGPENHEGRNEGND